MWLSQGGFEYVMGVLCWAYRKRVFFVSGGFRKALADLISDLHISNRKAVQASLFGEVLLEEKFCLLGFVPSKVLGCWKTFGLAC